MLPQRTLVVRVTFPHHLVTEVNLSHRTNCSIQRICKDFGIFGQDSICFTSKVESHNLVVYKLFFCKISAVYVMHGLVCSAEIT